MTKVTFVGDPNDDFSGPETITVWETEFTKNKPQEVSKEIAEAAKTHSHFDVEGEPKRKAIAKPKPAKPAPAPSADELTDEG